jgi:hypothetical protein
MIIGEVVLVSHELCGPQLFKYLVSSSYKTGSPVLSFRFSYPLLGCSFVMNGRENSNRAAG